VINTFPFTPDLSDSYKEGLPMINQDWLPVYR